tara:strand:- start:599 stop:892 length:294 start_codon:yes stop_codon:yes gene_type:complete
MHFRITKVSHHPDKREEVLEYLGSVGDKITSIDGLKIVRMVAISDNQVIAISEYDNEEQLKEAESSFGSIMAGLQPFITAPPEVNNGDVIWQHVNQG